MRTSRRGATAAGLALGGLVAGLALIVTGGPAAAQKAPPWEIVDVKVSGKAPDPRGAVVTEFGGDGKERPVFLHLTVRFQKAPAADTIRIMHVADAKKKPVGRLFNVGIDREDKNLVTLIYQNPNTWASLDGLRLRSVSHAARLEKKDDEPKEK